MDAVSESPKDRGGYRAARRAFIAACEKAHVDTVARLHPAKGPDGKPLFMDCAALGLRRAAKAVLVVGYDAAGTAMMTDLLQLTLPKDARLVLVHALDPALFAGVASDSAWPAAMLRAVATEDLSRVRELAVLTLGREDESLKPLLQERLPTAAVSVLPPAATAAQAKGAIAQFFAAR
jgi:Protein of unknown function (DUF2817)